MSEIDVSKCKYNYTSITKDSCCYAESERHVCMRKCKDFPNCYYKQLQRLKQKVRKVIDEQFGCESGIHCIYCPHGRDICEEGRNIRDILEIINN